MFGTEKLQMVTSTSQLQMAGKGMDLEIVPMTLTLPN